MNTYKGILAKSGLVSKIFLLIGATIFFATFGIMIWTFITNGDTGDANSMKIMLLFQSIGMFVLPPLVLVYFWSETPREFFHLDKKINWQEIFFVFLLMVVIIPFINLLGDLNHQIVLPKAFSGIENWMKTYEEQAAKLTEQLLNVHTVSGLLFNILLIAIIPAFGEELFFRGTLQRILQEWKGVITAIWITAFVFSAIHFQFYGFIPRMLLGAFFGYLLLWSGNLALPMVAHFTNNGLAVIFFYLKNNGVQTFNIDTIGTGNTLWVGIVSGMLGVFGYFFLKNKLQKEKESS